jgi:hypothetical protein
MNFEIFFEDSGKKNRPHFSIMLDGESYEFYSPSMDKFHIDHPECVIRTLERLAVRRLLKLAKNGLFPELDRNRILAQIRKRQLKKPLEDYLSFLKQFELEIDEFVQKFETAGVETRLGILDSPHVFRASWDEDFSERVFIDVRLSTGSKPSFLKVKNALSLLRHTASEFVLAAEVPGYLKTSHFFAETRNLVITSLTDKIRREVEKTIEEGKRGNVGNQIKENFRQGAKKRVKNLAIQMSVLAMNLELTYDDVLEIMKETFVDYVHES